MLGLIFLVMISYSTWSVGGRFVDYLNAKEWFVNFLNPLPLYIGKWFTILLYAISFMFSAFIYSIIYTLIK